MFDLFITIVSIIAAQLVAAVVIANVDLPVHWGVYGVIMFVAYIPVAWSIRKGCDVITSYFNKV